MLKLNDVSNDSLFSYQISYMAQNLFLPKAAKYQNLFKINNSPQLTYDFQQKF